jgi:hypothetical protein
LERLPAFASVFAKGAYQMKKFILAALLLASSMPASAVTITGVMDIFGSNYFDPANGFVPAGYGNQSGTSVVIGSGIEFGFDDGANLDTADFTNTSLTISDLTGPNHNSVPISYSFTADVAGFFGNLHLVSSSLPGTYSVSGNTLTYNADAISDSGTRSVVFSFSGGAVPEPASWAMFIGGFGLIGGAMRRRKVAISFG